MAGSRTPDASDSLVRSNVAATAERRGRGRRSWRSSHRSQPATVRSARSARVAPCLVDCLLIFQPPQCRRLRFLRQSSRPMACVDYASLRRSDQPAAYARLHHRVRRGERCSNELRLLWGDFGVIPGPAVNSATGTPTRLRSSSRPRAQARASAVMAAAWTYCRRVSFPHSS